MFGAASVRALSVLSVALLAACQAAPSKPAASTGSERTASSGRKILTVAALASYKGFGPQYVTTTGGGSRQLNEIHSVGLLTTDTAGVVMPRLARELPPPAHGDI